MCVTSLRFMCDIALVINHVICILEEADQLYCLLCLVC